MSVNRNSFLNEQMRFMILWIGICAVLFFHFANCESYNQQNMYSATPAATVAPTTNQILSSCNSGSITYQNSQTCQAAYLTDEQNRSMLIHLDILGSNPILLNPNDFALNVSGDCDSQKFPVTEIYYSLINNADHSLQLTNDPGGNCQQGLACPNPSSISCVNAHWSISTPAIDTLIHYDNSSVPFNNTQSHTLVVQMIVKNSSGKLYASQSTALKQVNIIPDSSVVPAVHY